MNTIESWEDEGIWIVSECESDMGEVEQFGQFGDEREAWKCAQKIAKARLLTAVRRDRAHRIVSVVRVRVRGAA